jgi:DnaK suppressor protein
MPRTAKTTKATETAKTTKTVKKTKAPKTPSGLEFNNFEPYKPKRGEKYMNEQQRAHFKSILLNWKSELMQEVDRTVTHMKDEAANFPDPADRATQEEEFSLELRTRDRERKLIKKIDSTMELIEQNDYGYCEACGVDIGIKRLEARPTATQCIDCKTLAEIKERQEMG